MRSTTTRRRRFGRPQILGTAILAAALVPTVVFTSFASADEIEELRNGIPTGEEVWSRIVDLSEERDALLILLNAAESDLTTALEARNDFDGHHRRLVSQIEAATDHLRAVSVRAFVADGSVGELEALVNVGDISELSWRQHLLRNHAGSSQAALQRLEDLEVQVSDEVRESIVTAERLRLEIVRLNIEIATVESLIAEAEELRPVADAWDRAAIAIEEGSYGIAPGDKWEKLRFCESAHDYQAVSPTGMYRGAYQFDFATWQTVGGKGDPAAAPAAEQDARARELYALRGHKPWPECGFHLQ